MKKKKSTIILGAGVTGLAAGYASGLPIYEAKNVAGGICTSYYMKTGNRKRLYEQPSDGEVYHFEIGGGHWIFGGEKAVLDLINKLSPHKHYARKASIYLPSKNRFVPYPIQNNLGYLEPAIAKSAAAEILNPKNMVVVTMNDWLTQNFGRILGKLFFHPFHKMYTAGLWKSIKPQDGYKSPINRDEVKKGLEGKATSVGYNTKFVYPINGLDKLVKEFAKKCTIHYGKKVTKIDTRRRELKFTDGTKCPYNTLISTLPLNRIAKLADISSNGKPFPSPSVLVINIGAIKGKRCPTDHWVYIPKSRADFHRVGFYSNVDTSFLPRSRRTQSNCVAIYVEKAYPEGTLLKKSETEQVCRDVINELKKWDWIEKVEVYDPTWIEVAYTWSWPNSEWKEKTLKALEEKGIHQIGRYGQWVFQGIADSIGEGLEVGTKFKNEK